METLLYKVRPLLVGKTEEVRVVQAYCDKCGERSTFAWLYRLKGDEDFKEEVINQFCSNCRDSVLSKEITIELEEKRKNIIKNNWWFPTIPDAGFKNYLPHNKCTIRAKESALEYTRAVLNRKMQNLLLMGSPGTGKTHLSIAIVRTLEENGLFVGYITSMELFTKIKKTFEDGSEDRLLREMKAFDVLCIDDIGVETIKIDEMSWTVRKWTELIENRHRLSSIWTTNLDDMQLRRVIGDRAASRMYENTKFIDLFTDDYRKRVIVQ